MIYSDNQLKDAIIRQAMLMSKVEDDRDYYKRQWAAQNEENILLKKRLAELEKREAANA